MIRKVIVIMLNQIREVIHNQDRELEKYILNYFSKKNSEKKMIYIAGMNLNNSQNIGIYKKVFGQGNAFKMKFDKVNFVFYKNYQQIISDGESIIEKHNFKENMDDFILDRYETIADYIFKNEIKHVYIRYGMNSDIGLINFLNKIREYVEKIYIEIPTYPYDEEIENEKTKNPYWISTLATDKYFRKFLYKYIDKIVTFSNHDDIYGVPTIKISNGIDINSIKLKKVRKHNREINLIGVANVSYWHGYDRIIEGLKEYYNDPIKKYVIKFHVVGQGSELENLVEIVNKYKLNEYVIFYGLRQGEDLDDIFDNCDIGIGALGIHRKNLKISSALKTREYCARGIPFIYSGEEKDISIKEEFVLNVKDNDDAINILDIVKFYENTQSITNNKIRKYAENNFDWNITMKEVVESFFDKRRRIMYRSNINEAKTVK